MFSRILLAVDGSEISKRAVNALKEIAEKFPTEVLILNVFEPLYVSYGYHMAPHISETIKKELEEKAKRLVEETKNELLNLHLEIKNIDSLVMIGKPGEVIVDVAEKNNSDLIIIGSRGLGSVKGFLMGSVSNYVLHHSKCPLLVTY